MSTEMMIPAGFGLPSTKLAASQVSPSDLGAGIGAAFAVISYKGKVWSIKHRGDSKALMRADGSGPQGTIETVIVKASPVISKIFYAKGFVDGDNAAPDCWSVNGVSPDPASSAKQSTTCAGCPKNAWGSRITESGKSGKACSDSKRLALVPAADMNNDLFGGPMLLRVPAASLQGLSQYSAALQSMGHAYYGVVTEIGFDYKEAFPLLTFKAKRVLTEAEVDVLLALQASETTNRILNEAVDQVKAEVALPGNVAALAGVAPATPAATAPPAVVVQPQVNVSPVVAAPAGNATPVAPNPFGGAALATPAATAPPAVVVQPPVVAPPVVMAPIPSDAAPVAAAPAEMTLEQKLAAAEAKLAAMAAGAAAPGTKTRKPRTPPPSPAPSAEPVVPVQVTTAPLQSAVNPQAITDLEAQLDALTGI